MIGPDCCQLCGEKAYRAMFSAKDLNQAIAGEFPIVRCVGCGVARTVLPEDTDLGALYPPSYYDRLRPYSRHELLTKNAEKLAFLSAVVGHAFADAVPRKRLLDIGCKTGEFPAATQLLGLQSEGVELSTEAAAFARRHYGVAVRDGALSADVLGTARYDIVTLWQVVEHLPHLSEHLKGIVQAMKPGGFLFLSFPNFGSLQARVFRSAWFHLDAPRHLSHITNACVIEYAEKIGLGLLAARSFSIKEDYVGLRASIMHVLRSRQNKIANQARTEIREQSNTPVNALPFSWRSFALQVFNSTVFGVACGEHLASSGAVSALAFKKS